MQSILRWSLENSIPLDSATSDRPPRDVKDLDPGIIDMILGRPDAELMKEDIAVAVDTSRSDVDRVNALDHLEMLVEQIDNANNLEKLRLLEPLHSLLTSDYSTPSIKRQVLWVLGTAVQNNPSAQDAYLFLNPLPTIVSFLSPSPSSTPQTRSKAIYVLSGLLKHNAPAVKDLGSPNVDGWSRLRDALQDPDIAVRRKAVFLLGTLLLPTTPVSLAPSAPPRAGLHVPSGPSPSEHTQQVHDNSHAVHIKDPLRASTSDITLEAFHTHRILEAAISAITDPLPHGEDGESQEPDAAFEEQCIRLLHAYVVLCKGELTQPDRDVLGPWIREEVKKDGEEPLADRWNLDLPELKGLIVRVA